MFTTSYWKAQITEHSFQVEENHVAIPVRWPSDFISSCQTSAVLFVVIHAGEGWRLKLRRGATGKSTNSFQEITTFNIFGSVGSFCKCYKSGWWRFQKTDPQIRGQMDLVNAPLLWNNPKWLLYPQVYCCWGFFVLKSNT